jgi:hypothetical protein
VYGAAIVVMEVANNKQLKKMYFMDSVAFLANQLDALIIEYIALVENYTVLYIIKVQYKIYNNIGRLIWEFF